MTADGSPKPDKISHQACSHLFQLSPANPKHPPSSIGWKGLARPNCAPAETTKHEQTMPAQPTPNAEEEVPPQADHSSVIRPQPSEPGAPATGPHAPAPNEPNHAPRVLSRQSSVIGPRHRSRKRQRPDPKRRRQTNPKPDRVVSAQFPVIRPPPSEPGAPATSPQAPAPNKPKVGQSRQCSVFSYQTPAIGAGSASDRTPSASAKRTHRNAEICANLRNLWTTFPDKPKTISKADAPPDRTAPFLATAFVPTCLRAFVPSFHASVPSCLRAFVPCLRAYVPPCLRAFVPCLRAYVPPCLRAFVPCLRASVPSCLRSMPSCLRASFLPNKPTTRPQQNRGPNEKRRPSHE